jgi:diacylglycerol kinase (ATP)
MVDGILDIQVFAGPRRNAFVVMPRLLVGSHLTHPAVRRYVGSEVSITCPDTWPIEADGELLGSGPVTISVLPGAIDLVI